MILMPWSAANSVSSGKRAIVPSGAMISQITAAACRPASVAISSEASVWPRRVSTPPGAARSGNTCPGRPRSAGFVCGLSRARIVVLRSNAEIPVETPWRASTEIVNGVPNPEVLELEGTIKGSSSASRRSAGMAMQIKPQASRAIKLMAAGVANSAAIARSPSFSRSSSSTMITNFPAR